MSNTTDKREGNIDRTTFRKRIALHRVRILSAVLFVVISLAVMFTVLYISEQNRVYTGYEVINTVEKSQVEYSRVLSYGSHFLTYSADGIHCTDAKGSDVWSFPFEMQSPMVEVCGNYVAVADYNGRTIIVFDTQGEKGTITTGAPIKDICISSTGVVAAIIDGGDVTPINLYYYDGTDIASFRTTMSKWGYPLTMGISDNGKLFMVSYLYLDNGTLTSKVAFYNFGEVGQNESDNLVSGYDYQSELIPVADFLDDETAYAVANDKLLFYEGRERPVNTSNILLHDKVQSVYSGNNCVGLVYLNTTGESKYRMDVYSSSGKMECSLLFDMEYEDVIFTQDNIVIYNAASLNVFSGNGRLKYAGDFSEPVSLMIPTESDNRYVLVLKDRIETIVLR